MSELKTSAEDREQWRRQSGGGGYVPAYWVLALIEDVERLLAEREAGAAEGSGSGRVVESVDRTAERVRLRERVRKDPEAVIGEYVDRWIEAMVLPGAGELSFGDSVIAFHGWLLAEHGSLMARDLIGGRGGRSRRVLELRMLAAGAEFDRKRRTWVGIRLRSV